MYWSTVSKREEEQKVVGGGGGQQVPDLAWGQGQELERHPWEVGEDRIQLRFLRRVLPWAGGEEVEGDEEAEVE